MILWLASLAWAGNVYINGTFVDPRSLSGITLANTSVRFDAQGNMYIDAPGYQLQPVQAPRPVAPQPPPKPVVAYGRWWVVTEDKGSTGHVVDVYINDQLAVTVRSGQGPQQLIEISKWLRLGENKVIVKSISTNAGGGPLAVFAGPGGTVNGAFELPNPPVDFGVSASRSGVYERQYTLVVDR